MHNLNIHEQSKPKTMTGFFKVWQTDPKTGISIPMVAKRNTIMNSGADVLARALAGYPNAKISHMYLAYTDSQDVPVGDPYVIDRSNSVFEIATGGDVSTGYLRVPLTFPATYTTSDSDEYSNNIVVFTVLINTATDYVYGGNLNGGSKFFEAALVASFNPADTPASHASDKVFARVTFDKFDYSATTNLTISWGVKITAA